MLFLQVGLWLPIAQGYIMDASGIDQLQGVMNVKCTHAAYMYDFFAIRLLLRLEQEKKLIKLNNTSIK